MGSYMYYLPNRKLVVITYILHLIIIIVPGTWDISARRKKPSTIHVLLLLVIILVVVITLIIILQQHHPTPQPHTPHKITHTHTHTPGVLEKAKNIIIYTSILVHTRIYMNTRPPPLLFFGGGYWLLLRCVVV